MRKIELGRTGVQVGEIALGAMQMGTGVTSDEDSITMLDRFLELGGTVVDTADAYQWWGRRGNTGGESEELLGRWMRERGHRDQVFLATKGGGMPAGSEAERWNPDGTPNWVEVRKNFAGAGADTLTKALDGSLRRLGTDHVDLYYVHVDDRRVPLAESLEAMAGFVRAGKVRFVGWSNVTAWRLAEIRLLCERNGWPLPVAIQQRHTYLRPKRGGEDELADYLTTYGDQTLVAYSPILKGVYDRGQAPEAYAGPDSQARLAAVARVAEEAGATPNQTVLAWLLRKGVLPLVGPRTTDQFENTMGALDVKLTDAQIERLDSAGA